MEILEFVVQVVVLEDGYPPARIAEQIVAGTQKALAHLGTGFKCTSADMIAPKSAQADSQTSLASSPPQPESGTEGVKHGTIPIQASKLPAPDPGQGGQGPDPDAPQARRRSSGN